MSCAPPRAAAATRASPLASPERVTPTPPHQRHDLLLRRDRDKPGGTSATSNEASATPVALPSPWATSDVVGSPGAVGSSPAAPERRLLLRDHRSRRGHLGKQRCLPLCLSGRHRRLRHHRARRDHAKHAQLRESRRDGPRIAQRQFPPCGDEPHPGIGLDFLRRTTTGGSTSYITPFRACPPPTWVRLVRSAIPSPPTAPPMG